MSDLHRRSIFATADLTYSVSVRNYKGERRINLHHPAIGKQFWCDIQHDYSHYDERNMITIRPTLYRHGIEQWPQMSSYATPHFDAAYSPHYYLEMIRLYPLRDVTLDNPTNPSVLRFYGTIELVMHDQQSDVAARYTAAIKCRLQLNLKSGYTQIDGS